MDIFLLTGQSNMAGRAADEANKYKLYRHKNTDSYSHSYPNLSSQCDFDSSINSSPRSSNTTFDDQSMIASALVINGHQIFCLNEHNEWVTARHPLHYDKPNICGIGPGLSFAKLVATLNCVDSNRKIGLIPCAVGGTSIYQWLPSYDDSQTKTTAEIEIPPKEKIDNAENQENSSKKDTPVLKKVDSKSEDDEQPKDNIFYRTLNKTKTALNSGKDFQLRAILWHQGESDSGNQKNAEEYMNNVLNLFSYFRRKLNDNSLPILVAGLGDFLQQNRNAKYYSVINQALASLPKRLHNIAFVTANKLGHRGDWLHFDMESANILGNRYALEFAKMSGSIVNKQQINHYSKLKQLLKYPKQYYNKFEFEQDSTSRIVKRISVIVGCSIGTAMAYYLYKKYANSISNPETSKNSAKTQTQTTLQTQAEAFGSGA